MTIPRHKAYQWFILTTPLGFILAAILAIWLYGKRRRGPCFSIITHG